MPLRKASEIARFELSVRELQEVMCEAYVQGCTDAIRELGKVLDETPYTVAAAAVDKLREIQPDQF